MHKIIVKTKSLQKLLDFFPKKVDKRTFADNPPDHVPQFSLIIDRSAKHGLQFFFFSIRNYASYHPLRPAGYVAVQKCDKQLG